MLTIIFGIIYLLSSCIAGIIAWSVSTKISEVNKPLIRYLVFSMCLDLLLFLTGSNTVAYQCLFLMHSIVSTLLLCWQAKRWELFGGYRKQAFVVFSGATLLTLIAIVLLDQSIPRWLSMFTDLVCVVIGFEMIKKVLVTEEESIEHRPMLLAGIASLLLYTSSIMLGLIIPFGNTNDSGYLEKAYLVYLPFPIISNILFIAAVMSIARVPAKPSLEA